jgi:hypothetical protein
MEQPQPEPHHEQHAPNQELTEGRWRLAEHERFLQGHHLHNNDWRRVAQVVGTRSNVQCRTHAQKHFGGLGGPRHHKKTVEPTTKKKEPVLQVTPYSVSSFVVPGVAPARGSFVSALTPEWANNIFLVPQFPRFAHETTTAPLGGGQPMSWHV